MAGVTSAVIDVSCVISLLLDEQDDGIAEHAWAMYRSGELELSAPSLIDYEAVNALRSGFLQKRLSHARVVLELNRYQQLHLHKVSFTPSLQEDALAYAVARQISVYDASYLALAKRLECPLITLDRRLRQVAALEGIATTV